MNSAHLFHNAWIISDGKKGDLVQCIGVAQALGIDAELKTISPTKPWVWIMPYGPIPPRDNIANPQSPIHQPLPDLVISSGWRTLAYVREIKKQQQQKVFTVYLKSPRSSANFLDLVWVPAHDDISGERIISSIASPHRFSPDILADEFAPMPDYLAKLPRPLVGVLLGGDSKDYHFSDDDCTRFAKSLRAFCDTGAGLAITPSRRTPAKLRAAIEQQMAGASYYWWDELAPDRAPNPYGFLLSQSDAFVVTADSANMVGEACVTGKSVYVFKPSGGSKKFDRLLDKFSSHGATRPLPEQIEQYVSWSYEPLYAAGDIADEIKRRAMKQFGH